MPRKAELSDFELRLLRMRSQRLLPGTEQRSVAAAASAALTIQAQDVPAAMLAVRARTSGLTAEKARRQSAQQAVCRSWLMRNTIFLFATADLAWMRPLLAERLLVVAERRLEVLGGQPAADEVIALFPKLIEAGPLTRADVREMLAERGVTEDGPFYWTLHAAALRGILVVRPGLERGQLLEAAPPDEELDRDEALGRLARRYLDAYGPATLEDFAYWAKIPKADARLGWENAGRTVEVEGPAGTLTSLSKTLKTLKPPASGDGPVVRLLGAWDHYLLGWDHGRDLMVPPDAQRLVHPGAGYIKATAFADGLAFGTWKIEKKKGAITIAVQPFGKLPKGARSGLEEEAADLGRFFETEAVLRVG